MSFFDDIEDDIIQDPDKVVSRSITNFSIEASRKRYIKEEVFPVYRSCYPEQTEEDINESLKTSLAEIFFKEFSSEKYHRKIGKLFSRKMVIDGVEFGQSKFLPDELGKCLTETLKLFSSDYRFLNLENYAIDTPGVVIYFLFSKNNDYSEKNRKIFKFLYNDATERELPFYDSQRITSNQEMERIPYERWDAALGVKPILMFGWEDICNPYQGIPYIVLNTFLGVYQYSGIDESGNKVLNLLSEEFIIPNIIK